MGGASGAATEAVNVLLVDDEPRNLNVLDSILTSSGYRLVRAQTADEALLALLAEWNSTRSYSARVQNIESGLGPILTPKGYRLRLLDTVFGDTQTDKLNGASGQDWLFSD